MNRRGKQYINNEAVYNILSHAEKLDDGSYIFTDLSNKIFLVDKLGDMYTISDDIVTPCNSGMVSSKSNGYIYVDLTVSIDGQLETIEYAQHSIVCALFNGLFGLFNNVVNHKDNCPFNNNPSNLEWTTQYYNKLHGRIVRCAADVHNSESKLAWAGYDLYKQTSNAKHTFDSLKVAIACSDIQSFEISINKSLNKYWAIDGDTDLLGLFYYDEFIKWWAKRNNINLKQYKHIQTA